MPPILEPRDGPTFTLNYISCGHSRTVFRSCPEELRCAVDVRFHTCLQMERGGECWDCEPEQLPTFYPANTQGYGDGDNNNDNEEEIEDDDEDEDKNDEDKDKDDEEGDALDEDEEVEEEKKEVEKK
ncbi:hypothetical protein BU23DRAFT_595497 [Bimuria novae-zelandiae CBS 107.79]|uniref:Uncharacterized protein n=1 Tax=Bimuria novae-zelandiae CBS 107.79 TaxID=1447943 RepID=A0A6A5VNW3_9PLEO|nr:hypothetical protein BU23DRAFT_595497 [Bimuria novae-zelandiae CBS 107.79]